MRKRLIEKLAPAVGLSPANVAHHYRTLAEAKLISDRTTGAPAHGTDPSARDAARLAIAVLSTSIASHAAKAVRETAGWVRDPANRAVEVGPWAAHELATAPTLEAAVAAVIVSAPAIAAWAAEVAEKHWVPIAGRPEKIGAPSFKISVVRGESARILMVAPVAGSAFILLDAAFAPKGAADVPATDLAVEAAIGFRTLLELNSVVGSRRAPAPAADAAHTAGRAAASDGQDCALSTPALPQPGM